MLFFMSDMQLQLSGLVVERKNSTRCPPALHLVFGFGLGGRVFRRSEQDWTNQSPLRRQGLGNGGKVVDDISI